MITDSGVSPRFHPGFCEHLTVEGFYEEVITNASRNGSYHSVSTITSAREARGDRSLHLRVLERGLGEIAEEPEKEQREVVATATTPIVQRIRSGPRPRATYHPDRPTAIVVPDPSVPPGQGIVGRDGGEGPTWQIHPQAL